MSASQPARKRLPVKPSEEHLRKQAKRRAKADGTALAEAQHRIAVEYGSRNWAELMHVVETMLRGADQHAYVKYDFEALPQAANAGDLDRVRIILAQGEFTQHDLDLALARSLFRFKNQPQIARLLLEHGADPDGQYGSDYGPIIFATGEGLEVEALEFLIEAGADVTFKPIATKYGQQCALSYWLGTYVRGKNEAKHRGVELLLKHGAFVPPEVTPPLLAIHRGDAKLLADLLDRDRSLLNKRFADMPYGNIELRGATLLHAAVEFGEIECLDELFKRYADINMKADLIDGIGGQTPIYHAIHTNCNRNFYTLEYLTQRAGQWIDTSVKATWRGNAGWAIAGFDPTTTPLTPLEYAQKAAQDIDPTHAHHYPRARDEVTLLQSLDRRAVIRQACERGDLPAVARMLDESPELLTPELWPATIFRGQSHDIAKLLLERGLDPNECAAPRKPLHLACDLGRLDIVRLLLDHHARLDVLDGEYLTPYELMCCGLTSPANAEDIRQTLREAGATDNVFTHIYLGQDDEVIRLLQADPALSATRGPNGFTPLQTAARAGRVRVVTLLLQAGVSADAPQGTTNTPLWLTCQSQADAADRIAVAKQLLDAGANPRRECENGSTPLHFAAWRGPVAMVELLLRHNAKEWQTDHHGKKPLDYARDTGVAPDRDAIIELLDRPVIRDPHFKAAVQALQAGDAPTLRRLLAEHPNLVHDRAIEPACYTPGYFKDPKLLWFVANNPTLMPMMPTNIVDLTATILDAGAGRADIDYTLELVLTSDPAREQGHQVPLIKLLMARGGTVTPRAIHMTLGHGLRDAVGGLLDDGLPLTASVASGLGRLADLARLLPGADDEERHAALSLAVINREADAARLCLDAGADVNRFLLVHAHSTPAHQAAVNDDVPTLRLLVEYGAKLDVKDTLWQGTPLDWAIHTHKPAAEAFLRSLAPADTIR